MNTVYIYLPISTYLCIYISICISIYPSTYLSIYLPTYLSSTYLSIHLSFHLHIYLSIHLSIHLHIYLPTYLAIYISIYPSIHLHIYLSIYLPTYLSIYISIYLSIYLYPSTYLSIHLHIYLPIYISIHLSIYCTFHQKKFLVCLWKHSFFGNKPVSDFWWAALDALSPHKSLAMQHNWDESRMHIQHQHRIVETWVCMSGWCEDDFTSRWSHNKTTSRFVMSLRFEFPSAGACRSVVLQPLTSVVYKRCYHRTHTQRSPLTASNGNIFRPPCVHSGDMFRWADVFLIVTLSLSW